MSFLNWTYKEMPSNTIKSMQQVFVMQLDKSLGVISQTLFYFIFAARFGIRPTLGQLCPRQAPPPNYSQKVCETREDQDPEKGNNT